MVGEVESDYNWECEEIYLLSNPYRRLCAGTGCIDESVEKIPEKEADIIYIKGTTETSLWNAGLWFRVKETQKMINEMTEGETSKVVCDRRPHQICPGCGKVLEEGDVIKGMSKECEVKRRMNDSYLSNKNFVISSIIGRFLYHKKCEEDILNTLNNIEDESLIHKI